MVFDERPLTDGEVQLIVHHTCDQDPSRHGLPVYYYRICTSDGETAGWCDLRIGDDAYTHCAGNIGYQIEEAYRGHHYAAKAVRLLLTRARQHGLPGIVIACEVDNTASRKTCEYAGGTLTGRIRTEAGLGLEPGVELCVYRFSL